MTAEPRGARSRAFSAAAIPAVAAPLWKPAVPSGLR